MTEHETMHEAMETTLGVISALFPAAVALILVAVGVWKAYTAAWCLLEDWLLVRRHRRGKLTTPFERKVEAAREARLAELSAARDEARKNG